MHQFSSLVGRSGLLFLLLEPVLLNWGGTTRSARRTLKLNSLGLVGLEVVCEIALFWGFWGGWDGELLDVAVGIGGFDGDWLVGFEFAKVQVLDEVGWVEDGLLVIDRNVSVISMEVCT